MKWVKHFGNVSEDELVKIIKDVVPDQGYEIALWIPFAYIKNQSAIIEIARLVAETNSFAILEYIHRFGIEDENIQLEIIEIAAQKHSIKLPYVRGTSSLSNQQKIIEIGKLYGNDNCFMAIGWIKRFNVEDQNVRIEMAKTLSEKAEEYLSMCFNEFGITDAKARAEIAMSAAKKRGYQTCEYIENYEIQDEEVLFNIAKAAVDDNSNACRLFGNFKIQDESLRVAFAMYVANKNGGVISENISHVVISDENDRIKIAKQAAMNDGHSVSKNIQSFAIENQEALFEIAKLAAMNNPGWTAMLITNFGIIDEKYRVEIAKIIAQRHGEAISSNIRYFKIEDQNALKEIAILSAINHGYNTSMSIKNYGLESEEARIEVAMAAGGQGSNYFANFEIENLEARIRIAKHVMPAEHIKTFKIYDKKVRAEIALLAAQQPGGYYNGDGDISQNIKKFEIDEASRIAVAKIAAQKNGYWTTQHFDNYEIESEKTRIEIAKISVRQDGPNTIRFMRKYNIEQTDKVFEFLLIAISNSEETFKNLKSFPKTPYDELVKFSSFWEKTMSI